MPSLLICVSHGPALTCADPRPAAQDQVEAAYQARARALQAFDPELVVIFAPDHYTGIHLQMVPPFCIAAACEAADDYGGYPGRLNVPAETAWACLETVRAADIDIAASHDLIVDHGFSQPLKLLTGAVDRYPVLPIFINTTCRPLSAFRRVRLLGETIGRFVAGLDKRVAFIGSGGLSHHPANIFPQELGATAPELHDYLLYGGMRGGMNRAGWLDFLGERTVEGGLAVARGERTARDFRLNPKWDRRFLDQFATGDYAAFDPWEPAEVIREAGVAAMEIQQWIAAGAAAKAAGSGAPTIDFYHSAAEYRISIGVAHAN
jgi:2,3-dihydroxyphenylpropionate 1,2-dioxygenase